MNFNDKVEDRKRRSKEEGEQSFNAWISQPMTRMAISMIPCPEGNPEILETILRDAFDAGYGAGGASIAMEMVSGLLKAQIKKDDQR